MISGYRLYPVRRAASFKALPVIMLGFGFIAQRLVGDLIFANRSSINKNFYLAVGAGSCQCYSG